MKNRLPLSAIFFVLFAVLTACRSSSYLENETATRDARLAADRYWKAALTQCGEYSYRGDSVITVYKDFDFTLRDLSVSQSDHDQGVGWRMRTAIKPGIAYRIWDTNRKQWEGDWSNVGINGPSEVFENRNGSISFSGGIEDMKPSKVDCATAPK